MTNKTCNLKDLNFSFDYNENCASCEDGECHAQVQTDDGHYQIHVLGTSRVGPFIVSIFDLQNGSDTIIEKFSSDSACAVYLRDTFNFKCE